MIATLKVITILATAFFGIFGSFVNFRDRTGRITRNGWIGLIGVIVAGLSAACLQLYSEAQQEKSTLALLTEINRTLHPLPGLKVGYSLRPDWQKEGFRKYFTELEASFDHPTSFGTLFFPEREESPLLHHTVCYVEVTLFFFREVIDPVRFEYKQNSGEDLRINVRNPCYYASMFAKWKPSILGRFSWDYNRHNGKLRRLDFEVSETEIDSTSDGWRSNSKITSLQDLLGAQLIVKLYASGYSPNAEITHDVILEHRQSIELADLIIRLRNGIVMGFDADNLKRFPGRDGFPTYSFTFPRTMNEFIKATQYDQFKKLGEE